MTDTITPSERENAAIMCSSRACAEGSERLYIGQMSRAKERGRMVLWTPNIWTTREQKLAKAAFDAVVRVAGWWPRPAALWAEAESLLRCGWSPENALDPTATDRATDRQRMYRARKRQRLTSPRRL